MAATSDRRDVGHASLRPLRAAALGICVVLAASTSCHDAGEIKFSRVTGSEFDCENNRADRRRSVQKSPFAPGVVTAWRQSSRATRFPHQHAPTVHFGLGEVDEVEAIEVRWVDGTLRRLSEPKLNTYHFISRQEQP
ncbi:MAG: ASPIC/UnbV domain-containing protein [Planctomycetes bacterium]|nr:ASPIC/UnbV domain-containing protein [Planctomycetota bacterium]